jgi:metal-responsive CopG/Arc/MetJ family transcriptional regulator
MITSSFIKLAMRTIVDIPNEQLSQLDQWADRERISRAEAVRRALAQLLDRVGQPKSSAATGFGLWAQGKAITAEQDGLRIQQALRDEWPE